jgi:hypothetical protein
MGGYGSTRWNWHNKKMAVEDCHKLPMRIIHSFMQKGGRWGGVTWSRGGEPIGNISYRVIGGEEPESLRLIYTITKHDTGEKKDLDYPVRLTTTPLPWGGQRYWFICPAVGCGRRVSVLYLAPGGDYFACRHCYRLSYRSSLLSSHGGAYAGYSSRSDLEGSKRSFQGLRISEDLNRL